MALVVKDRVQETTVTVGTIALVLTGAVSGFQSFSVIGNGNTTYYAIVGGTEWEVGIGTYTALGTTLSRDTILESSNGGTAVNFSAGTKNVFVTYPAEKGLYVDASGNAIALGTPASATLTNATGLPLTTGVTGTLPVANGGTNQTSYTNGQLLIGNTTGNTLAKATLTAGTGISVTNGAGSITIANSAPSIAWQSVQTGNFNATAGSGYPVNTTSGAITVTLPASPTAGDAITLTDYASTWATNNVTVAANGNKLNSAVANAILSTNRQSISLVYIDATQGWIAYNGFLDSIPVQTYSIEYLIVGGGGGGGGHATNDKGGGGGGAGGYVTGSATVNYGVTSYAATIGGGGSGGGTTNSQAGSVGGNGSNTTFGAFTTAVGGGGGAGGFGGQGSDHSGVAGGSGGGATRDGTGGSGTSGQGYAGGNAGSVDGGAGGGGAAGGGSTASGAAGANGGSGNTWSDSVAYAGGGGGGAYSGSGGTADSGGGAGGNANSNGTAGTANRGGGGGGAGGGANAGRAGAAGGSGIVIVRYSGLQKGTGGTVTSAGGYTYHTFTSSGTYTA